MIGLSIKKAENFFRSKFFKPNEINKIVSNFIN